MQVAITNVFTNGERNNTLETLEAKARWKYRRVKALLPGNTIRYRMNRTVQYQHELPYCNEISKDESQYQTKHHGRIDGPFLFDECMNTLVGTEAFSQV